MTITSLYKTYQRYRTLQTDRISSLPIVILMPHSSCNCRCSMCDIWKDNHNLKQLTEADVESLLHALKQFNTQQVVMSGGEALLHPNFFKLCSLLRKTGISVTLLSTGLTVKKHAQNIAQYVNEMIVSLDGDEVIHDSIRNIPGAYRKMKEGISVLQQIQPNFKISARSVIHKLNFRKWPDIIETAKQTGFNSISFLPADISSVAFNRELLWDEARQNDILISEEELPEFEEVTEALIARYKPEIDNHFISESAEKLRNIYRYYAAFYGRNSFPYKRCNAPWVSTVIEPDGTVRPCFFHKSIGNIRQQSLDEILNGEKGMSFRKNLDLDTNDTCKKCVCYLNLHPHTNVNGNN